MLNKPVERFKLRRRVDALIYRAGRWISCKGDKSYVYDLVHLDEPAPQEPGRP